MHGMSTLKIMNKFKKSIALFCMISSFILVGCEAKVEDAAIDWQHYEDQMCQEDKNDFNEYLPVLNNEKKFIYFDCDNEETTFDEFLAGLESDNPPDIEGIVLVDMDDQNGKELIIGISESGGHYLILTRDNGNFYGKRLSAREFEELQEDGKYLGSGGAGDLYFHKMEIDSNGARETLLGEVHGEEKEDGSYGDRLEVNGQVVDESLQDWMDENYGDPAEWIK